MQILRIMYSTDVRTPIYKIIKIILFFSTIIDMRMDLESCMNDSDDCDVNSTQQISFTRNVLSIVSI